MTKASSEILCDRSRYIYIGRSHTRRSVFFVANHIIYMQRRSGLAYWTQDYRRFCQQTRPTRTLASRILRLQSINRARTANRRRGNARAVRAPLTSAGAYIARSSLRASRGYAGRRRRPPNRKERSPASTHMRKRQTVHPPISNASTKRVAAMSHLTGVFSTE